MLRCQLCPLTYCISLFTLQEVGAKAGNQSGGRAVDAAWVTLTVCLQAASVSPVHTQLHKDRLAEKTLCCGLALLMMLGLC